MAGKRLLVVEDDPKSLYAFEAVLQARGFDVVACANAEDALHVKADHFDAAIVDVRLPRMQGTEFATQLQRLHPTMRIIFVTAYDGVREIQAAIPQSVVLLKPVDMDVLLRAL